MARIKQKHFDRLYAAMEKKQGRRPAPGTPRIIVSVGRFLHCLVYIAEGRIWKGDGTQSVALAGARVEVNTTGQLSKHFSAGRAVMLGAFGATKTTDTRELYVVVQGTDSGFVVPLSPDLQSAALEFAAKASALASQVPSPTDGTASGPALSHADVPDQIRKLAELCEQGVLTNVEFDHKKSELLARM